MNRVVLSPTRSYLEISSTSDSIESRELLELGLDRVELAMACIGRNEALYWFLGLRHQAENRKGKFRIFSRARLKFQDGVSCCSYAIWLTFFLNRKLPILEILDKLDISTENRSSWKLEGELRSMIVFL